MKKVNYVSLMIFLTTAGLAAYGQSQDFKTEKESVEMLLDSEATLDSLTDNAIKNSYLLKSFEGELSQEYENVKQEKNKWLSTFRLGVNFFSLNTSVNAQDQSVTTAGVLPNLGLTLGIDPEKFINRQSYIREAKYNVIQAENQLKNQRRQTRDEIIRFYYLYLEALGIVELRDAANQMQIERCVIMEERFRKGEAQMDEVLQHQSAYVLTQEALLKARIAARKIKKEIELFTSDTESQMPAGNSFKNKLK